MTVINQEVTMEAIAVPAEDRDGDSIIQDVSILEETASLDTSNACSVNPSLPYCSINYIAGYLAHLLKMKKY